MKQYKCYQKILICIFPFVCAVFLFFAAKFFISNFSLPRCLVNVVLGIHCPGCGFTRAVIALVHGDIMLSLRQNAALIFSIILFLVFYIEFALRAFGCNIRFPIHGDRFLYTVLILWGVYAVLRNIIPWLMPI